MDPKDEEAYNSRGLANRLLGRLDDAMNDFSVAIHIKDDYSRPYNNRGTIYLAQGQPERRHRRLRQGYSTGLAFCRSL